MANEIDKTIEELEAEVRAEIDEAMHDAPKKSAVPAEPMKKPKNGEMQDTGKAVVSPTQGEAPSKKTTAAAKEVSFYYVKRIQDAGGYSNTADVPYRFVPCMVAGLAYYLSQKYKPELVQQMKLLYEDELARALAEDGSASSTYITPKAYYPSQ